LKMDDDNLLRTRAAPGRGAGAANVRTSPKGGVPIADKRVVRFRAVATITLCTFAIFLAWEIVTRSFGAYLADAAPANAITLRSTNPEALLNLVDASLNRAPTGESAESVVPSRPEPQSAARFRKMVELVLAHDPLNARAFRILGQLADIAPDDGLAERFMKAAARRSLQETAAVTWLLQKSSERQDYATALKYGDILLRTRPQAISQVTPILAGIAENKIGNGAIKQLLADNPPWRRQFLQNLPSSISDARTPLDLLLSLKDTSTPPVLADLRSYIDFLIARKFHELAYYTWLQFLPRDQLSNVGHLFNGSFESVPSGLPFDWILSAGSGVTIDVVEHPDQHGDHALFIEFGHGRVEFGGVLQLTMLAPGKYQFQGKYKGSMVGRRGLIWRLTCENDQTTSIAEGLMVTGAASTWQEFEFSFSVPKADCRAQRVRLVLDARSESEQFISGSIWYDDLRIMRAE
jgi:hypothetical protein